jgi:WD40 repeat protein
MPTLHIHPPHTHPHTPPRFHQAYTRSLAYDPEGAYLAAVAADGSLAIWDIQTGKQQLLRRKACPKVRPVGPAEKRPGAPGGCKRPNIVGASVTCAEDPAATRDAARRVEETRFLSDGAC